MTNYYRIFLFVGMILLLNACKSTQTIFLPMEDIRQYGLVFRLPDNQRRIDYFEKKGLTARAQAEKAETEQANRKLVQRFRQEFNFCPIRFYYTSQQAALLAGKPVLLNDNLQTDASIPLPEKVILANFDVGEIVDNTFEWKAFRVVGTSIAIRPTYFTWWFKRPLQVVDVKRINRMLYRMN